MINSLKLVKERHINSSIGKVWNTLTETSTDWNGVQIETTSEWKPNAAIIFSFVWDGVQYADKGKLLNLKTKKYFHILIGVHFQDCLTKKKIILKFNMN